ncbi:bifunctional isocitrate dehydrogenase kinase/phosphatase [Hansschlegelia zhihuaiae]|uniref:Bifunctional isocitrate dehydrogenase kinase/phosphatase n=1 Tax=Hansschlegelia zhihuaiae TaxID=405005 RepID=A0A4Q0MMT3_9HYPH|nr:bifunctional isocitrate dehydrogenase kinase/phosphatase [Hansschlegelia zhihuaiae]RXF75177.1 bifunctional isocitrate dehydrogenase kinase/phosphatase [Hansschlegelia zhihuaiae]
MSDARNGWVDALSRRGDGTEEEVTVDLSDLYGAIDREERISVVARLVHAAFDEYYRESRAIPLEVKAAFETRRWPDIVAFSKNRLARYSVGVERIIEDLKSGAPELKRDEAFWKALEARYLKLIEGRYEADLAFAFLYSIRRELFEDVWKPAVYAATAAEGLVHPANVLRRFETTMPMRGAVIAEVLDVAGFSAPWRDKTTDARLAAMEINRTLLRVGCDDGERLTVEMVEAGFYRNRGAYLLGRILSEGRAPIPLLIAVLNNPHGLYVDAVLMESDQLQYVFSSTLANFHVTNPRYHELATFLHELMPKRPLGTHYSTIGFNHVGKRAIMDEIASEHGRSGERFTTAAGFRGTVAIGFSAPSSAYVLKVIRDRPTEGYKWGSFAGVDAVLDKYRLVHDADRAGSMLDNVLYSNVTLRRELFSDALLEELLADASKTVSPHGDEVLFRHLIVQMKMIPLTIYLDQAGPDDRRRAVLSLGDCIKNNAAVNIFNKDLDGRNYGVSPIGRVYLFDYDAVEPLTEVKIRTNVGREEGEEDVPDWFFEDGTVFLPEEMMTGLRINDPELRRLFKTAHPQLMSVDYWEGMQRALCEGKVPMVRSYPSERRLHRHVLKVYGGAGTKDAAE